MSKNQVSSGRGLYLPVASGTKSGDPVLVGAGIVGVAEIDRDGAGYATVNVNRQVWDVPVKAINGSGNSAVAVGDLIYLVDADTPKLSKKATGVFFGYALETITSGSTDTINVLKAG